jgi:hypothetical protein
MSWAVGWDSDWGRDVGYGVPAWCDHPLCDAKIDRGLGYVCGGEPFGGEAGCGLYFCTAHLYWTDDGTQLCDRCDESRSPFHPTPDHPEWIEHKLTDPSWGPWRAQHPAEVSAMRLSGWQQRREEWRP